jgi:AraC family transcriptional activator of pobA
MDKPYITLDLSRLPEHQQVAALGESLVLHDNFEKSIDWDCSGTVDFMNFPIKVSSTMLLFFCLEGEVHLRQNMQEHVMRKNDVTFVYSGLFGEVTSFSHDLKFALIVMSDDFYYPIFNSFDMSAILHLLTTNPVCPLPENIANECLNLYKMIRDRLKNHTGEILQNEILQGYLQALTFCVYSQYQMVAAQTRKHPMVTRQKDLFNRFIELLQKHYAHERRINYYADKLCVTPRYLSRVINDVSGHFASDHIDLFVIAEAKQLLRNKKYTVLQVSEMLNFTSQSLFGRYFKKFTGQSPKEYQNIK